MLGEVGKKNGTFVLKDDYIYMVGSWRNGLVVKTMHCSSRRSTFGSQNPSQVATIIFSYSSREILHLYIWVLELMCTYSAPIYTHTYENNLYHPTLEFKSSLYLSNNLPGDAFFSPFYLPPTPRLNILVHGPKIHSKAKSWQHVTSNFYIDHKLVNAILIFTIIYFSGQKSPS